LFIWSNGDIITDISTVAVTLYIEYLDILIRIHFNNFSIVFQGLGLLASFDSRTYFSENMNLFGQLVGLLGRGICPTQGLYLYPGQHST